MDKRLKQQYLHELSHIKKLMNEWDPMGLIQMGAPEDEYNSYSAKVLIIIQTSKNNIQAKNNLESYLDALIHKELDNPSCIPASMIADRLLEWFTIGDSTQ
ncbi:hypothetical protein P4V43_01770 [Brevibacillus fortis]|uniref:hypothetical protein n=1 Tax=Brevibacillus fortis TaxID=2126352 RepID=UPI002E1A0E6D|nr:hypothetical protein [Brevibacillus fortis]